MRAWNGSGWWRLSRMRRRTENQWANDLKVAVGVATIALRDRCGVYADRAFGSSGGLVYAIEAGGLIKVGRSMRMRSQFGRLDQIQAMCPVPVRLLSICHGHSQAESAVHRVHRKARHHGEWFALDSDPLHCSDIMCWGCSWWRQLRASVSQTRFLDPTGSTSKYP